MADGNIFFKFGWFYKNIVSVFGSVFSFYQYLFLDEGMVLCRENFFFCVYNFDKLKKYVIKVYMLCNVVIGYCLRFKFYIGKLDIFVSLNGVIYNFVMDMMRGYFGQCYIFYMDNYYSLLYLYMDLFVFGCGVIEIF